jgi:hypothetical protein
MQSLSYCLGHGGSDLITVCSYMTLDQDAQCTDVHLKDRFVCASEVSDTRVEAAGVDCQVNAEDSDSTDECLPMMTWPA